MKNKITNGYILIFNNEQIKFCVLQLEDIKVILILATIALVTPPRHLGLSVIVNKDFRIKAPGNTITADIRDCQPTCLFVVKKRHLNYSSFIYHRVD